LCSQVISCDYKGKVGIIKAVKKLDVPTRFSLSYRFKIHRVETSSSLKAGCKNCEAGLNKCIQEGLVGDFQNRDDAFDNHQINLLNWLFHILVNEHFTVFKF
jgi:hypothetical protein